jgi:hypothetical protein
MTNYFEVDKVITCAGTAPIASTAVDIYAIKEGKDPLLMKRQLAVTAGAWTTTMTVPSSYVSPFGKVYLKVVDSYNPTIAGTKFYTIDPTLTIDTPTLTEGVEGSVTGTSNYVGQHIEVEVRLSGETPEDAWTPFGTATVAGDGSWTVSGTIASADTYDFRVIDENIDPAVCSAQVDDVVVASGAVALQFGGTDDDINLQMVKVGTDYYIAGATKSATLFGENTGRSADYRMFLCKLNSAGAKQWVVFGDADGDALTLNAMAYDADHSKLFWISDNDYSSSNVNKIKRVDMDGAVEATYTYSTGGSNHSLKGLVYTNGVIYLIILKDYAQVELGRLAYNFSTTTGTASAVRLTNLSSKVEPTAICLDTNYVYVACYGTDAGWTEDGGWVVRYKMSDGSLAVTSKHNKGYLSVASSGTRILVMTQDGTNRELKMYKASDMSLLYTQDIDTNLTETCPQIIFDTKFYFGSKNVLKTQFTIYEINDSDSYGSTTHNTITPNSGTMERALVLHNKNIVGGCIDGKLSSDSTDAGGIDCFIYDEE